MYDRNGIAPPGPGAARSLYRADGNILRADELHHHLQQTARFGRIELPHLRPRLGVELIEKHFQHRIERHADAPFLKLAVCTQV